MSKSIVFCGYGRLGVECLDKLISNNYKIKYILTHEDMSELSVDKYAIENCIEYSYDDTRKNIEKYKVLIQNIDPEYLISINYRYIIYEEIFSIPKHSINIHGSLLPMYRGRTPHVWSIINGEEYAGITCHLIETGVDTGDIISQTKIKIHENYTGYNLLQEYEKLYPEVLIESINKLDNGFIPIKQDESKATYFGKRTPIMGYVDFRKNSKDIINFVRAQAEPYPGAYYYLADGTKIIMNKIIKVDKTNDSQTIGNIFKEGDKYYVYCSDSCLELIDFKIV